MCVNMSTYNYTIGIDTPIFNVLFTHTYTICFTYIQYVTYTNINASTQICILYYINIYLYMYIKQSRSSSRALSKNRQPLVCIKG